MTKTIQQLDPKAPPKVQYCVPVLVRDENIRTNTKLVKGRIEPEEEKSSPIAIVGYGPSLQKTWKQLKKFKTIFTCSGAHKFLVEKGIKPERWLHLDVDPRPHKKELIGVPQANVEYLMASAVHPSVIEHLLDHKANVKLWHIFAVDGESEQVLPRGEWSLTGGCDAGMRCMTLARFLGYKDQHIFGMDASQEETKHAGLHPNQAKDHENFEYKGKVYKTTPAWRACASQVFKELDQLKDVSYKFYGEGLIQAMAKDYVRNPTPTTIGFVKDPLISNEMRDLNAQLHKENMYYGTGGSKYAETVTKFAQGLTKEGQAPPSVLDYGCGKGHLAKSLEFPIFEYDPAIPGKDEPPRPADVVICSDVLEHIEPETLDVVLNDLARVTKQLGYLVIHTGAAKKSYSDGRNAHLIQEGEEWWRAKLKPHFAIGKVIINGPELHVVVSPKSMENVTQVGKMKFYTPNDATKWRAKTILTKEPITIEWIDGMQPGETLFDIGANVGGYTVYAGCKGLKVYAFEPEAENFAVLCKNLQINALNAIAYPVALTDVRKLDRLYLSQSGAGGSCHTFGESKDFKLEDRPIGATQGILGVTLDELGLPQPDHIKLDVDGLEHLVIKGAMKTLKNVKSILIEINPNIPKHLELVDILKVIGFTYDEKQAERARRTSGPFLGVGEIVFRPATVEDKVLASIEKAEVIDTPYPHLVLEDLPTGRIQLPDEWRPIEQIRGVKGYPQRFVGEFARPDWTPKLKQALLDKFGLKDEGYADEWLLIKDHAGYQIGPHTDHPNRILSAIFYLAQEGDSEDLGTSLYTSPKGFTCKGGPHYPKKGFKKVKTVPYKPNSAFVFLKGDKSFHGVERTSDTRHVLLYDIRRI
jgi:FkbM family methyltransferase